MAKIQFSGGGGWVGCQNCKYSKCQEMAKFQFSGGEGVKTENTQSAKKWLNFSFQEGVGEGGRVPKLKILKVPRNG